MENIKFYLDTEYPLALDSLDYQYPEGAIQDNSRRQRFNDKLRRFSGSILDLGCAGGGFVKDCIDEGRIAVGLEGTDFNKNEQKFEWATIPDNLFTCDLTKPFVLHTGDHEPFQFNIITAWEFFEHIEKNDIPQLLINIKNHLLGGGLIIASIDGNHYPLRHHKDIDLHRTVEDREWWLNQFEQAGFVEAVDIENHFARSWLRESKSPRNYKFVLKKQEYKFKTPLCELAFKYGTDKCPQIKHRYTEIYYKLFKDRADQIKKVLEIGIGYKETMNIFGNPQYVTGASLRMWRDFFPNAQIYGMDVDPRTMFEDERITTFCYDQMNYRDLELLVTQIGSDIDIVIEDAAHTPASQIVTCLELMPLLNKNVIYIIEDISDLDIMKAFRHYNCQYIRIKDKAYWDERLILVTHKDV